MRIRTIKPEFWRSDDIDKLEWHTRLLFIGLWSYVDDNGVGRDRESDIAADLFAGDLSRDPLGTLARVSDGLEALSEGGQIARYTVGGKHYLYICSWESHQKIDKPSKPRFPPPTCEDASPRERVAKPSRAVSETPAPGTGEQGNRGTGDLSFTGEPANLSEDEDFTSAGGRGPRPANEPPHLFAEFWQLYPRRQAKQDAIKAWKQVTKDTPAEVVLSCLSDYKFNPDPQFIPLPASWLRGRRWEDETVASAANSQSGPAKIYHWNL